MNHSFQFPTLKNIHPQPTFWQRTKFFLRHTLHSRAVKQFTQAIRNDPFCEQFFRHDLNAAYPIIHRFTDTRFSAAKRGELMIFNIDIVRQLFGEAAFTQFTENKTIPLMNLLEGDLILTFGKNDNSIHEGMWAIALFNREGVRIYAATLTFLPDNKLLIASFQGGQEMHEEMKVLTKKLDHFRPQSLLMAAVKIFAEIIDHQLLGIDKKYQVKHFLALKRRIKVNYDQLWQENGGQKEQDGYWQLPYVTEKPLSEIATRKRAQYRRRYALLQTMRENINNWLLTAKENTNHQTENK